MQVRYSMYIVLFLKILKPTLSMIPFKISFGLWLYNCPQLELLGCLRPLSNLGSVLQCLSG